MSVSKGDSAHAAPLWPHRREDDVVLYFVAPANPGYSPFRLRRLDTGFARLMWRHPDYSKGAPGASREENSVSLPSQHRNQIRVRVGRRVRIEPKARLLGRPTNCGSGAQETAFEVL